MLSQIPTPTAQVKVKSDEGVRAQAEILALMKAAAVLAEIQNYISWRECLAEVADAK